MVFDGPQFGILLTEIDAHNSGDFDRHYPVDSVVAGFHLGAKSAKNASDRFGSLAELQDDQKAAV